MMPVYEYFCPQCYRELEVLRPIQISSDQSDCPYCGGKAWRLVSGFGSKTGSYLQPAGVPFRVAAGWPLVSGGGSVATAAEADHGIESGVADPQALSAIEMSWLLEWQPKGSNLWFIQDWGVASVLRYLREYLDIEPGVATPRVEDVTETPEPMVASTAPWPDDQPVEPAAGADTRSQAPAQKSAALVQRWLPTSYYGRLMLLAACTATIAVTVVWILATAF